MHTCIAKVELRDDTFTNSYEAEQLQSGFVSNLCGVPVSNALVTVGTTARISLLIVNHTLRRRCLIARHKWVERVNIISALEAKQLHVEERESEQGNEPEEFRVPILKLLKKNIDLFATNDKVLGRTDTVKIRINTDGHVPIKNHSYHTTPHKKKTSR